MPAKRVPKVVFIERYKKTASQNPRGQGANYNRILGDAETMVNAFEGDFYHRLLLCSPADAYSLANPPTPMRAHSRTHVALGVSVVTCCDFSVATIGDMLALVHDADVVVSLHGAGLINAIFSRPGVIVVELHASYGADDVIFRYPGPVPLVQIGTNVGTKP